MSGQTLSSAESRRHWLVGILNSGQLSEIGSLDEELVDMLIELSFSPDRKLTDSCFGLLKNFEEEELIREANHKKQVLIDALAAGNFESLISNPKESIGLLIDMSCSANLELKHRARVFLAELEIQEAKEELCRLALENETASQIAADAGIAPSRLEDQVVFYAISRQWEKYDELDPDMSMLSNIYKAAPPHLQERFALAIASREPLFAVKMLIELAVTLHSEGTCCDQNLLNALAQIKSPQAIDHFCQVWSTSPESGLKNYLIKLKWTAREPLPLRLQTALLTGRMDVLDLESTQLVECLIAEIIGGKSVFADEAVSALRQVVRAERIDQIAGRWLETGDLRLANLIKEKGWLAAEPLAARVATGLLNKDFAGLYSEKSLQVIDISLNMFKKPCAVDLKVEVIEFLNGIKRQDFIDRLWQVSVETGSQTLRSFLLQNQMLAAEPLYLRTLSHLLIKPEALSDCDADTALELLRLAESDPAVTDGTAAESAAPQIAAAAMQVLAKLKSRSAIDALCLKAYEASKVAQELALSCAYAPSDESLQAGFFLRIGDWQRYKKYDPLKTMLAGVYDELEPASRIELLRKLEKAGQVDLLSALIAKEEPGKLAACSRQEWEMIVPALKNESRWQDIWICAQLCVPVISHKLFRLLKVIGWEPESSYEREFLDSMSATLRNCNDEGPGVLYRNSPRRLSDRSDIAFLSADGKILISDLGDQRVRVRQLSSAKYFNADGRLLAAAGDCSLFAALTGDGILAAYYSDNGTPFRVINTGLTGITRAVFSHDASSLYLGTIEGKTIAIEIGTGKICPMQQLDGMVEKLVLSRCGKFLAAATSRHDVHLISTLNGRRFTGLASRSKNKVTALAMSAESLFMGVEGSLLESFDLSSIVVGAETLKGRPLQTGSIKLENELSALAVCSENSLLVGIGSGKLLRLDAGAATAGQIQALCSFERSIQHISTNSDGSMIVCSLSSSLRILEESFARLAKSPLASISSADLLLLKKLQNDKSLSLSDRYWAEFMRKLAQHYSRYDIEIADSFEQVDDGRFDIDLE